MDLTEKDFVENLWNYFNLHSSQRIQLINFYIVLETFLFAGLFSLVETENDTSFFCILISFATLFFSFLFYNLDVRTKQMIKICEDSIKKVEAKYKKYGEDVLIFSKEEQITSTNKNKFLAFPLSYAKSFKLLFFFFSTIGLACIIYFSMQLI